jgi:hypothetical protein
MRGGPGFTKSGKDENYIHSLAEISEGKISFGYESVN